MATMALIVILAVASTSGFFLARNWRELYREALKRASESEREVGRLTADLGYLKDSVSRILSRPLIATFTHEQLNQLSLMVINYINASQIDKTKVN